MSEKSAAENSESVATMGAALSAVGGTASPQLMLFAEDFPVNRTPLLADEMALKTSATCGRNTLDSFANLNLDGSWRKTCQGFSQLMMDGSLEPFSETWPRAGMTRNGIAYQLPPSAPLTKETEFGWWDTELNRREAFVPTLLANNLPRSRKAREVHKSSPRLVDFIKRMPTLIRRDRRSFLGAQRAPNSLGSEPLTVVLGGTLNPRWCEWFMGYPQRWCDVEKCTLPKSARSATRLSRRSRNGSRAASSQLKKTPA